MIDNNSMQAYFRRPLETADPQMAALIGLDEVRQETTLNLIASESVVSRAVDRAESSPLRHKYGEGYDLRRYYPGCEYANKVEQLTIARAKAVFAAEHANVQALSGVPANLSVYLAALKPGDPAMGMLLSDGGHLSHGHLVSASGILFKFSQYGIRSEDDLLDYEAAQKMADEIKPKLIVCGASAYSREIDFFRFREIADSVHALLMVDISHIAGLVVAGLHPSPVKAGADFVTTTTHKTMFGPRSALILAKKTFEDSIDKAVFPGLHGGPHFNTIAAVGVALLEAQSPEFKALQEQIILNARTLAETLTASNVRLLTGGTDNHLMLADVNTSFGITGKVAQDALEAAGIAANRNSIRGDKSPFKPMGLRFGTPTVTARGMKETEVRKIGGWIFDVLRNPSDAGIQSRVKGEVLNLCQSFPLMDRFVSRAPNDN